MKNFFSGLRIFSIICLFLGFCASKISAIPLYNRYDPYPIYNVFGSDKYYAPRDKSQFIVQLSPFYQTSSGARDYDGGKVPEGDMLGRWNMFGLFYGYTYQRDALPILSPPAYTYFPKEIPASPASRIALTANFAGT